MSVSLANRKKFFIRIKKSIYNLIIINKDLLLNKNKRINKEIELLLIVT